METFNLTLFLKALGLAAVIEGVLWAGFPGAMREAARWAAGAGLPSLRGVGLGGLVFGALVIWLACLI